MRSIIAGPRRVPRQPEPSIYHGLGDCGACVIAGLLDVSVHDAYAMAKEADWSQDAHRWADGRVDAISHQDMRGVLCLAERSGLVDRVVAEQPCWPWEGISQTRSFGLLGHHQARGWIGYLRMAFDAGYYAATTVDSQGHGANGEGTDHWVLLCGFRRREEEHPTVAGARCIHEEVLIADSSRRQPPERWEVAHDFLKRRGGMVLFLARPS